MNRNTTQQPIGLTGRKRKFKEDDLPPAWPQSAEKLKAIMSEHVSIRRILWTSNCARNIDDRRKHARRGLNPEIWITSMSGSEPTKASWTKGQSLVSSATIQSFSIDWKEPAQVLAHQEANTKFYLQRYARILGKLFQKFWSVSLLFLLYTRDYLGKYVSSVPNNWYLTCFWKSGPAPVYC